MQRDNFDRSLYRSNLENDHLLKKARAKIKTTAKKAGKNIKKAAKTVGKAAVKVTKAVTSAAVLAPLIPLQPVMKAALKKQGVNPPSKLADLAEVFYNKIVKTSNFDTRWNRPLYRDGYNNEHITGEIVTAIVAFVKSLLQKKKNVKAGAPVALNPTEKTIANGTEKVLGIVAEKTGEPITVAMPGSNAKDSNEAGGVSGAKEKAGIETPIKKARSKKRIPIAKTAKKSTEEKPKKDMTTPVIVVASILGGAILLSRNS